jgi:hypothetical protein
MSNSPSGGQTEIPRQIFDQFLVALAESDVPNEVVQRLRQSITNQADLSDKGIKVALFQSDPTND